ncbi:MAG: hypothetical protein M3Y34_01785, partial [Actinomycetota bacterium]|nr:hypothetical protein [Actinomycetota bacterium]
MLAPPGAQAQSLYREITKPKGKPQGAMLVLHGGGWRQDPAAVAGERTQAKRFAREGWLVWNVDYGSGAAGFDDVEYWHRTLGEKVDGPLCV